MRAISFIVSALAAAKVSAEDSNEAADNAYFISQQYPGYMGMGERMYGEPYGVRYVVEEPRYVTPEPRYIEHPRYGVPAYEEPSYYHDPGMLAHALAEPLNMILDKESHYTGHYQAAALHDTPAHVPAHVAAAHIAPHVTDQLTHPGMPHITPLDTLTEYTTQHYDQHDDAHENHFHHDEEFEHRYEDYHHIHHQHTCWRHVTARHAGYYPTCDQGSEQSGEYCYENCQNGFSGVGAVCYQDCMNFGNPLPPPLPIPRANGIMANSDPTKPKTAKPQAKSDPAKGKGGASTPAAEQHGQPVKPVHQAHGHPQPSHDEHQIHPSMTPPKHVAVHEEPEKAPKSAEKPAAPTLPVKTPELLSLVGVKTPMIASAADPRRGMHEDHDHCYKEEAIRRGPGVRAPDEWHPYPWNGKFYPACPPNYRPVGCCMCSPMCPQGMVDVGYKCKKDSYMRHGTHWGCREDEEKDGDLCYNRCEPGTHGDGPTCVSGCPAGTTACGNLCLREGELCDHHLRKQIHQLWPAITDVAEHSHFGSTINLAELSKELVHPNC